MLRTVLWTVTCLRVVLIPVFLWLAVRAERVAEAGGDPMSARWLAAGALVAMGVSDIVDGWMARRFNLATQLGAIVDAAADKLIQVTLVAFFTLVAGNAYASLPAWFLGLLVGRDAVLGGGLLLARARGTRVRVVHRAHGRATSVLVFIILGWLTFGLPRPVLTPLLVGTGLLVVVSGGVYFADGLGQARRMRGARTAG